MRRKPGQGVQGRRAAQAWSVALEAGALFKTPPALFGTLSTNFPFPLIGPQFLLSVKTRGLHASL